MKRNKRQQSTKKSWFTYTDFDYAVTMPNSAGLFTMDFTSSERIAGGRLTIGTILSKEVFPPTAREMQSAADYFTDLCNESLELVADAGQPFEHWQELLKGVVARYGGHVMQVDLMTGDRNLLVRGISPMTMLREMILDAKDAGAATVIPT
jgi:hypothetical protein